MLRGIYSAASAMSLSMQKMNLFAQNLSNSQTNGYKKKTYAVHSFEDMMVQLPDVTETQRYDQKLPVSLGSYIDGAGVKQAQGELHQTGNALNLAIMGEKIYFQFQTKPQLGPDGKPKAGDPTYTISRNGNFMTDRDNYLITTQGDFVLDKDNKKIRLTADPNLATQPPDPNRPLPSLDASRIRIDQFGKIFDTADKRRDPQGRPIELAQIKLVEWTENGKVPTPAPRPDGTPQPPTPTATEAQAILKKYGLALPDDHALLKSLDPKAEYAKTIGPDGLRTKAPLGQADPLLANIKQGYLESSNVDITTEMINMMMTSKDYDMSQKLISAEDKILDKTINEMGRLQ